MLPIVTQDYYLDGTGRMPRYCLSIAVNRTVEAIARGEKRVLLVMATGIGKTRTAFQIIWRLWKSGAAKRILFLADRNILVDESMNVQPLTTFGTPVEIVRLFGGKAQYEKALRDLETALYAAL